MIWKELLRFLRQEKKWWLIPLLVSFLILIALIIFTRGPAPVSPFMYPAR
jgi:putative effector of murein hydrolase